MPGPAGMMNVTGQVNQAYPGQMSSMGQQPTVVSYMTWKICTIFLWSYTWKHGTYFYTYLQLCIGTGVDVWESEKCWGNISQQLSVSPAFFKFSQTSTSVSIKQLDYELEICIM